MTDPAQGSDLAISTAEPLARGWASEAEQAVADLEARGFAWDPLDRRDLLGLLVAARRRGAAPAAADPGPPEMAFERVTHTGRRYLLWLKRYVLRPLLGLALPTAAFFVAGVATLASGYPRVRKFGETILNENLAPVSLVGLLVLTSALVGGFILARLQKGWGPDGWPWRVIGGARKVIDGWIYSVLSMGIALALLVFAVLPFGSTTRAGQVAVYTLMPVYCLGGLAFTTWADERVTQFAREGYDPQDRLQKRGMLAALAACAYLLVIGALTLYNALAPKKPLPVASPLPAAAPPTPVVAPRLPAAPGSPTPPGKVSAAAPRSTPPAARGNRVRPSTMRAESVRVQGPPRDAPGQPRPRP